MRVYASTGEKEITQWISTKGYFITDLSSMQFKTPARWNIQALSDCNLYTIHQKEYDLLQKYVSN